MSKPQRIVIDLERNEDLAKVVADVEPGQTLRATLSVVAKDDKTLTVELDEVDEPTTSSSTDEDDDGDEGESDDDTPALKVARGFGA